MSDLERDWAGVLARWGGDRGEHQVPIPAREKQSARQAVARPTAPGRDQFQDQDQSQDQGAGLGLGKNPSQSQGRNPDQDRISTNGFHGSRKKDGYSGYNGYNSKAPVNSHVSVLRNTKRVSNI